MMFIPAPFWSAATPAGGDPYFNNVILLVQGGADASLDVQDYSPYADLVTITNYAEFDDTKQVFGANSILTSTVSAAIPPFTSTGLGVRFGRETGDKFTIECWVYVGLGLNFAPSGFFFSWWEGSNRILEVGTTDGAVKLRLRNGTDASIESASLSSSAWHFLQMNIDGSSYTLDVDAAEIYAGSNAFGYDVAGVYDFRVASQTSTGDATGPTTEIWVSPLRVTKGVLRARGSVPTDLFPLF